MPNSTPQHLFDLAVVVLLAFAGLRLLVSFLGAVVRTVRGGDFSPNGAARRAWLGVAGQLLPLAVLVFIVLVFRGGALTLAAAFPLIVLALLLRGLILAGLAVAGRRGRGEARAVRAETRRGQRGKTTAWTWDVSTPNPVVPNAPVSPAVQTQDGNGLPRPLMAQMAAPNPASEPRQQSPVSSAPPPDARLELPPLPAAMTAPPLPGEQAERWYARQEAVLERGLSADAFQVARLRLSTLKSMLILGQLDLRAADSAVQAMLRAR